MHVAQGAAQALTPKSEEDAPACIDGADRARKTGDRRRKVEREVGEARFTAFSRSRADFDSLIAWKRAQLHATGQTDLFQTGWTMRLLREATTRIRDSDGDVLTVAMAPAETAHAFACARAGGRFNLEPTLRDRKSIV